MARYRGNCRAMAGGPNVRADHEPRESARATRRLAWGHPARCECRKTRVAGRVISIFAQRPNRFILVSRLTVSNILEGSDILLFCRGVYRPAPRRGGDSRLETQKPDYIVRCVGTLSTLESSTPTTLSAEAW